MDDREIVAAIVAGDLPGLAAAYDEHAESLYGYCRWMLREPEDAADAVEDTFIITAGRLDRLRDPRKLRPWLYAVARNECHSRLRASEVGLGEDASLPEPPAAADVGGRAEQAELARLVRTALDELSPGEREAIELDLRHDLQGADLAAVLGVPRNQAQALASHARGELEAALGPLFVARTGRRGCAELDLLLDGWDGQLTGSTRKLVSRHIEQCAACDDRSHGALRAAVRYGMAPLAALPPGLRDEVLELCTDSSPETLSYRRDVTQRAGAFLPNGFPQAIHAPRRRMIALSGAAAVVGVLVAIMATGIVTVLALTGSHAAYVFHYHKPVLQLRDADQQLLEVALRGSTDEETCQALGMKLPAIKKRWAALFHHIAKIKPELLPGTDDGDRQTRGPQKRHRLLAYLREHPEELRPVVRSRRPQ